MNKSTPYLNQYCCLVLECHSAGIDVGDLSKQQAARLRKLKVKAMTESGLSDNELWLICMCRKYKVLDTVNDFALKTILLNEFDTGRHSV